MRNWTIQPRRTILDGHIVLSRSLAGEGIYPAVDVCASISRLMSSVVDDEQLADANLLRRYIARYDENRDLINVGAYSAGVDPVTDAAIEKRPLINEFLSQSTEQRVSFQQSADALRQLLNGDQRDIHSEGVSSRVSESSPERSSGSDVTGATRQDMAPQPANTPVISHAGATI